MSDATVLIVDDSLTVRMDLAEAFESGGFDVTLCATATEARAAIAGRAWQVVILDVLLPDGDGVDLLTEIRAAPWCASTAVLMLSTEAEVGDRVRGLRRGADEYVGKPYNVGEVLARARDLIRERQSTAGPAKSVLVIDESQTTRQELRRALEQDGYTVVTAHSGEEGLRAAATARPNAVVVGASLPGISGDTVIRRMRLDAALRNLPCLFVTGDTEREAELRAFDAGADAFVGRDSPVEVVLAKLAALLRHRLETAPARYASSLLAPKRILAVDDNTTFLNELGGALRQEGYDVVLARSGAEALELVAMQPVDCILLDLNMPGLSSQETCRRIKAFPAVRDIPVIILTALADQRAIIESLACGADDHVTKTGDFEVLNARVRAQIRRKQFEDENRQIREELLRRDHEAAEARASREIAEERAAHTDELRQANEDLRAFSYTVSHDLRAPLRTIGGFSAILLEDYEDRLDETGRSHLREVFAAVLRMDQTIDGLLQLARTSNAELHYDAVDVSAMARAVGDELGRQHPGRSVELVVEDGLVLDADARLMRTLLDNLIGNAWKFTARTSAARVEVGTEASADGVCYFVRDNGVGFDAEHAPRLFQPFQRLHTEDDFPGTGIGLATVRRIVSRHGGRVWARSSPGLGASIYFTVCGRGAVET